MMTKGLFPLLAHMLMSLESAHSISSIPTLPKLKGAFAVAIVTALVSGERKGNLIKFQAKTHLYYLLEYYQRFHSESQHDPALPNQRQAEKLVGCTVFKFQSLSWCIEPNLKREPSSLNHCAETVTVTDEERESLTLLSVSSDIPEEFGLLVAEDSFSSPSYFILYLFYLLFPHHSAILSFFTCICIQIVLILLMGAFGGFFNQC